MPGTPLFALTPLNRTQEDFDRFYRTALRMRRGSRVNATELRTALAAWLGVDVRRAPSFRALTRMMSERGHWSLKSSLVYFVDVELVANAAPISAAAVSPSKAGQASMLARIDRAIEELNVLRAEVLDASAEASR